MILHVDQRQKLLREENLPVLPQEPHLLGKNPYRFYSRRMFNFPLCVGEEIGSSFSTCRIQTKHGKKIQDSLDPSGTIL